MKARADSQKSGLAGELFVAAELLKRDLQVSLTLGNAKSIDLFAYSEDAKRKYTIQVKTLRKPNCFPLQIQKVNPSHIYVFVMLNKPGVTVEYYILSGKEIFENKKDLYCDKKGISERSAVKIGPLKPFKDRWELFDV
jgi:hypothetical protein